MRRRCQGTLPAPRPRDRGLAQSPDLKGSAGSATSPPACYRDSGDPEKLLKGLHLLPPIGQESALWSATCMQQPRRRGGPPFYSREN